MDAKDNKLVIINQDVGYMFIDLANVALEHYEEVNLVNGSIVELGSRLDDRVKTWQMFRYRRRSVLSRFASWLLGFLQVAWLLRTRFRTHETVVASNPPLNTLLPLLVRNKMGLYVLDMYPEALHKTGVVSPKNPVVRVWSRLNALAYRRFSTIWALTPSMKATIEQEYEVEVGLAPAWASAPDTDLDRSFLDRVGLKNAWTVLYSGNLGREHEVEALLDCAAMLSARADLVFVVAGEGWKKKMLEDRVTAERLTNVQLLPKLPAAEFSALIDHARIGVVTQSLRTADVCIPSKTFNLLAAGLPILGIGKPGSDFGELIDGTGSGRVFLPGQVEDMCRFLSACWEDESVLRKYRARARLTSTSFTRANAERLMDQFATGDYHG